MSNFLQGKVALVTGGSRGLGAATARSLADAGADVAITYTASADKAAEVVKELEDKGVQAAAFQSDQAHAALAPQLIDDVVARFGGLDIVVNNAGIGVESGKTIDDPSINTAELDRMHATNYTGVIAIIRAAAKVLRDNGRIINIGSGIGTRAGTPGFTDYAATKAGLIGYTKGAARDLARRGITVNMAAGTASGAGVDSDTLVNIEGIVGSNFADTYNAAGFTGASGVPGTPIGYNEFEGGAGNDTVIGDVNARRGRIEKLDNRGTSRIIRAFVPLAEMFGYATDLRSRTQGRATYTMQFHSYQEVPGAVSKEIIARVTGQ